MRRSAFTLFEMVLVILLLGMITAFFFPDFEGVLKRRSLTESADRLRALIVMTHAKAMQEGIEYRIEFPGTADPDDPDAELEIDVPLETLQPEVLRQSDALGNPGDFEGVDAPWSRHDILQAGTRCVAVLPGRPSFDIDSDSVIAGPSVNQDEEATFVPLTLYPDGSCDWVTFVLTDLPFDVELEETHVSRIINVIVDGRTGQVWMQRALTTDEVELMEERGASPILHVDYTSSDLIDEDNVLEVNIRRGSVSAGGGGDEE